MVVRDGAPRTANKHFLKLLNLPRTLSCVAANAAMRALNLEELSFSPFQKLKFFNCEYLFSFQYDIMSLFTSVASLKS